MTRHPSRTVALASQYEAVGNLLRHYLSKDANIVIPWETTSGKEAIRHCAKKPPRVLITSPTFHDLSAPELTRNIREQHPEVRILLFAGILHRDLVQQMIDAEVHGIVAASSPLPTLLTAIEVLLEGGCYFDGIAETHLHARRGANPLSPREKAVLRLVADGLSTKEVADHLGICVKTAEKFRERIMKKLNLHDVVRLTRYAIRTGISALE